MAFHPKIIQLGNCHHVQGAGILVIDVYKRQSTKQSRTSPWCSVVVSLQYESPAMLYSSKICPARPIIKMAERGANTVKSRAGQFKVYKSLHAIFRFVCLWGLRTRGGGEGTPRNFWWGCAARPGLPVAEPVWFSISPLGTYSLFWGVASPGPTMRAVLFSIPQLTQFCSM